MNSTKLLKLVERCGVDGIRDRGTDIQACCPYHGERNPSWGISKREPHLFGCFACDAKGSIVTLLIDKLNLSRTAAEQMAEVNRTYVRSSDLFLETDPAQTSDLAMEEAFDNYVPAAEAYRYLMKRGVSVKTAKLCGIRYDFELERVLFPWMVNGRLRGFTGRAIDKTEKAKTLPYNETAKGDFLYVPDPKFSPKDLKLVLVEGEIDCIKVWQDCQMPVAAVGFGKFTPEQQAMVISWSPREVVTFFDDDDTGRALHRIVRKTIGRKMRVSYADYRSYRHLYPEEDKLDPACLSAEHRREILSKNRSDLSL